MANFVLGQRTVNRLYLSIEQRSHIKTYGKLAYLIILIIDDFQSYIHSGKTCTKQERVKTWWSKSQYNSLITTTQMLAWDGGK